MNDIEQVGTFKLGDRQIKRMGYGAMQLAGPGVFGPPKDIESAIALLRAAVEYGVDHIDTSDFYGPHITNRIIREALHPYPKELTLVTKIGARRNDKGDWIPAFSKAELTQAVHDNLDNLGLEQIEVVNFRAMFSVHSPAEGSISAPFSVLAELQQQGLIRHLGVSNVTRKQIEEARTIAPIVCVQNHYNLAHRHDDALINQLAQDGIAYVPFFPLGGFTPLQSTILQQEAETLQASPLQVALAWLLQRSSNILLIPGTSSLAHLQENLAAAQLALPEESVNNLNRIANQV